MPSSEFTDVGDERLPKLREAYERLERSGAFPPPFDGIKLIIRSLLDYIDLCLGELRSRDATIADLKRRLGEGAP